jgi:hypothetical protein
MIVPIMDNFDAQIAVRTEVDGASEKSSVLTAICASKLSIIGTIISP